MNIEEKKCNEYHNTINKFRKRFDSKRYREENIIEINGDNIVIFYPRWFTKLKICHALNITQFANSLNRKYKLS